MFHKTSLRLTGLYLAIIMIISFAFSTALYSLAMREVTRGLRQQNQILDRLPSEDLLPLSLQRLLEQRRKEVIREAQNRILSELLLANAAILFLGGGFSYLLARKTLEPIEKAHQSLEQFTADASHELRTPVAAMKSEIEVALLQPKLTVSEAKDLLNSNLEELDRLTLLTEGLLSIARQEEAPLDIKQQELRPIIQAALKKVSSVASEKSISFIQDFTNKTPKVTADRHSLLESLVILLDNAIKFSGNNSSIEVKVRQKKDRVTISIVDHGSGIKPIDLPHVFERFYRGDASRSQTVTGHGLGLPIAKQLLESQNATLGITSVLNQSTTATIALPK